MYYEFYTREGLTRAFISFESYNDRVSIWDKEKEHSESEDTCWVDTSFYNNVTGDLCFKYKGEEIKFKDFKKHSMKEMQEKIKNNEYIDVCEMMQAIICDGMENVRLGIELSVPDMVVPGLGIAMCSDKTMMCSCKLVKEYLHRPHTNYKIKVIAADDSEGYGVTCGESFYTSNFQGMNSDSKMKILDSIDDGKTADEHIMEYFTEVTNDKMYEYKMKVATQNLKECTPA